MLTHFTLSTLWPPSLNKAHSSFWHLRASVACLTTCRTANTVHKKSTTWWLEYACTTLFNPMTFVVFILSFEVAFISITKTYWSSTYVDKIMACTTINSIATNNQEIQLIMLTIWTDLNEVLHDQTNTGDNIILLSRHLYHFLWRVWTTLAIYFDVCPTDLQYTTDIHSDDVIYHCIAISVPTM